MRRQSENSRRPAWRTVADGCRFRLGPLLLFALLILACGCTSANEYIQNGYKVGPNYKRPPAPVAERWIEADDVRVRSQEWDHSKWWAVFNDPILDDLVHSAYRQNLTLREAGFRVLESRAKLSLSIGNFFPQTQTASGDFTQHGLSDQTANRSAAPQTFYPQYDFGFNLAWELDFWGRFRRAIESSRAELDVSVEDYDDVLVTLVGDIASTYVQIRTYQQGIAFARQTLELQRESLKIATAKFQGGQTSQVDVHQGQSDVSNTEALIEQQLIPLRQASNRLCVLLGMPPEDLLKKIGDKPIPVAPPEVVVGVPADLIRRRPEVRRAERRAAAQCAQIGVAVADLYPQISIAGTFGWSAEQFGNLFAPGAFRGTIGPTFTWNVLNYGRLLSNIRIQDARFQQLVAHYQQTVLRAGEDVENGLVTFLRAQKRARDQAEAVNAEALAFKQAIVQYENGLVDYNRVVLIQERLVSRQLTLAEARGQIALGLIQVYRALGGGWQIRCAPDGAAVTSHVPGVLPAPGELLPVPDAANPAPQGGNPKLPPPAENKEAPKAEEKPKALPLAGVNPMPAAEGISQGSPVNVGAEGEIRWEHSRRRRPSSSNDSAGTDMGNAR